MEKEIRGEERLKGLSVFLFVLSLAVLSAVVLGGEKPFHLLPAALLALALVAAESMGEEMVDGGRSTYGIVVIFCAVAALSTPSAMAVALLSGLRIFPPLKRKDWPKVLYNGASSSLTVGLCAYVYHLSGGASTVFTLGGALRSVGPLFLSAAIFWVINAAVMAMGLYFTRGVRPKDFLMHGALPLLPAQLVLALAGWGLGVVFAQNTFHLAGPEVVSSAAEAFRGFFAVAAALLLLGVTWHFSGKNVGLLEIYDETLRQLVDYLERREPYLDGHSTRVMNYSLLLGRKLNLPLYEIRKLGHAALLHDIGRAAVPREILAKQGTLSAEEFEKVKQHPLVGASWLEEVEYLSDIAEAVRHHHEFYDGGGYVDHLEGETIPLGARILALADAFEAMLKDRPYRNRKEREEAAAELRQGAGKQFDPRLVELFLGALRESGLVPSGVVEEGPPEHRQEQDMALPEARPETSEKAVESIPHGESIEGRVPAEKQGGVGRAEMRSEKEMGREPYSTIGDSQKLVAKGPREKARWTLSFGAGKRRREEMIRRRMEARERWKQEVLRQLSEDLPEEKSPTAEVEDDERGV